ncbi:fungal-specific transcription factor domain-containing protein [Xylaria sp. CBS 124048]|nr:fungal-specific transcription factor domain-containing protein [Xylaria sp. CBS 124048]
MLSNPLQRFSPYHSIPSDNILSPHVSGGHAPTRSLEPFGHGPQYARQRLQQVNVHTPHVTRAPQQKNRQHPYGGSGTKGTGSSGPIRRRISRACDQCNQLRTKCDGQHPCAHCIEFGLGCEYIRERKKRGKASRKDLAQQAAAAAATDGRSGPKSPELNDGNSSNTEGRAEDTVSPQQEQQRASPDKTVPLAKIDEDAMDRNRRTGSLDSLAEFGTQQANLVNHSLALDREQVENSAPLDFNGYGNLHHQFDRQTISQLMGSPSHGAYGSGPQGSLSHYPDLPFSLRPQGSASFPADPATTFRMANAPIGRYPLPGDTESPGWMNASPPPSQYQTNISQNTYHQQLRYPVLSPLIPHLGNIIPLSLACDLIDLYFSSSSSAHAHPMSPYVLGFVFRKRSFLHPSKPRLCQPALLASMLWAAAQTSDAPFLTQVPSARGKICQKLLELTVNLLKPLIHTPSSDAPSRPTIDGVFVGGLVVNLPNPIDNMSGGDAGAFGAAGSLDDVVTYIHLATVVSASEYKGASIRWWNAAWSLARELKLGRELPPNAPSTTRDLSEAERTGDARSKLGDEGTNCTISEEEREERRRIWWLVYIMDRHLALCYNRPLSLLDIECESLLQPMDDTEWQNGNFGYYATDPALGSDLTMRNERGRGPQFKCTGHSIFGYFLPLMTILGEIVDLHHARNHPRFGVGFRPAREWDDQQAEIVRHLETYEESLNSFQQRHFNASSEDKNEQSATLEMPSELDHLDASSVRSAHTNTSRMTESDIQTRIVVSYGTHVMHVLHILLTSKWDPINLLDDNDLWISSQSFITATGHAVSAAEAISNILEYDPGLEFMPFFYGIYLLQGSFLLLLIADKLQGEASPSVVRACETIIRAHEACVVTLNTEYQRNFSRVMRSALAQVRGRVPEDLGEQHQRRRELLALYRWTGDGSGLAL